MNAPFFKFGLFGPEVSLIVAFVTGIAFGFFLERAGFGNARKLAAQFYFRDLRVLKVMFTAIVTAMVGLYWLARLGLVDLSLVYLVPTFLVPQVVGGLVLGFGFVIGGYCPGTSCVSAATGRIDGIVYVLGMFAGIFVFAELYPMLDTFAHSTSLGQITLAQAFGLPYGVLVCGVVFMALGAFAAAEWAEKRFGDGTAWKGDSLLGPEGLRLTPVRTLAVCLAVLGLGAAFGGDPYRGSLSRVDAQAMALEASKPGALVKPEVLADWIVQGKNDFRLIDLRSEAEWNEYRIPTAQHRPLARLTGDVADRNETVVLYASDPLQAAQGWFVLRSAGFVGVRLLEGGFDAWKSRVLFPSEPPKPSATESRDWSRRVEVSRYFGGQPQRPANAGEAAPMPKPTLPSLPVSTPQAPGQATKPKARKEGC